MLFAFEIKTDKKYLSPSLAPHLHLLQRASVGETGAEMADNLFLLVDHLVTLVLLVDGARGEVDNTQARAAATQWSRGGGRVTFCGATACGRGGCGRGSGRRGGGDRDGDFLSRGSAARCVKARQSSAASLVRGGAAGDSNGGAASVVSRIDSRGALFCRSRRPFPWRRRAASSPVNCWALF